MRLIFVSHKFSWFINAYFRKFGSAVDKNSYEKAISKDSFRKSALFFEIMKISRLRKFLVLQ